MTLSLYIPVAGRTPQRHATLPTHQKVQSTTPLLQKYYSSTALCYKVLQNTIHYAVLQSTTPALLSATKCYKALLQYYFVLQYTPYYEVLLQYYAVLQVLLQQFSVLQSSTSVLLCSTIVLFSTVLLCNTKYRRLLPQFYSVLQSTTTTFLYYNATMLHNVQGTTRYYSVLLCTTKYYSITLYYKVPLWGQLKVGKIPPLPNKSISEQQRIYDSNTKPPPENSPHFQSTSIFCLVAARVRVPGRSPFSQLILHETDETKVVHKYKNMQFQWPNQSRNKKLIKQIQKRISLRDRMSQ